MEERFERYRIDRDAFHRRARTGPCLFCEIADSKISRGWPGGDTCVHVVYEDDAAIAFLDKYPREYGHTLVAPKEHREQITGDFTLEEYLALQRVVYRVAEAVRQEVNAERVYLLSLGSQQGNSHAHWHIEPSPPGVPYEQQQGADRGGVLRMPEEETASLAARISRRIEQTDEA